MLDPVPQAYKQWTAALSLTSFLFHFPLFGDAFSRVSRCTMMQKNIQNNLKNCAKLQTNFCPQPRSDRPHQRIDSRLDYIWLFWKLPKILILLLLLTSLRMGFPKGMGFGFSHRIIQKVCASAVAIKILASENQHVSIQQNNRPTPRPPNPIPGGNLNNNNKIWILRGTSKTAICNLLSTASYAA